MECFQELTSKITNTLNIDYFHLEVHTNNLCVWTCVCVRRNVETEIHKWN